MKTPSIAAPEIIRHIRSETVIYVPWDIPSRPISAALNKRAQAKKDLEICVLYKLRDKIVLVQAVSAPLAVLALEPLIASGAKEIILLGYCGSLARRFKIADIISISKAFSDEGTSRHYLPRKQVFSPSPALKGALEDVLTASGLETKTGAVVSTDAPYRETRSWMRKNQKRGAELVDMETSAVFALAEFHKIRAASVQIVSDELFSGRWKPAFSSPVLKHRAEDCFLPLIFDWK
jgi:uridine phosphorylase